MTDELTAQVVTLVTEALQVSAEEITPETAFGDLPQWDSMGHMEIMLALEERFGVEVSAETIGVLTSVPLIVKHLQEKTHG